MTLVLAVLAAVVVVVGSAWAVKRRGSTDAHSVEGYRQTLDTLQSLGARPATSVRARRDDPGAELGASRSSRVARRPVPPQRSAGMPRRPPFGDAGRPEPAPPWAAGRRPSWRPPRRGPAVVLVAAVVVVLGIAAAIALTGHSTPGAKGGSRATGSRTSGSSAPGRKPTTTTTTLPTRYSPADATTTAATYTTPGPTFAMTFTATSGSCWVQVTDASGKTVFAASVAAGTSQTVTGSGPTTVDLGAPTVVQVALDHAPVELPAGYRAPFTMTFAPAGTTAVPGASPASSGTAPASTFGTAPSPSSGGSPSGSTAS